MVKRFLIAAIVVGLFLGGVGYFNLVFKPKMIGEFMAKMVPPPATVTAEAAKTESWIDRVRAIGTLVAIEGVDIAPQVGGIVTDYFFDSGRDVAKGDKLVKLDTSVEEADLADNKATLQQANLDFERHSKLVKTSAVSQAALEANIGKFTIGSAIELTAEAYPGQLFKGEVEAFDAKLGQDTRTLMVRARVPNPDRKLLPGMFANVAVLAGGAKELVTVPRTAVTYGLYGDSVWAVKEGASAPAAAPAPIAPAEPVASAIAADATPTGSVPAEPKLTAERRFVRVGPTEGDRVAILEGVKDGEQVVTSGQLKLQPGATIKVDNSGALKAPVELPKQ